MRPSLSRIAPPLLSRMVVAAVSAPSPDLRSALCSGIASRINDGVERGLMPSLMPRVLVALLLSAASDRSAGRRYDKPRPTSALPLQSRCRTLRRHSASPCLWASWCATRRRPHRLCEVGSPRHRCDRAPAYRQSHRRPLDTLQCPMPIARVDTATLSPMPVAPPTGDLPIAGQLKGARIHCVHAEAENAPWQSRNSDRRRIAALLSKGIASAFRCTCVISFGMRSR